MRMWLVDPALMCDRHLLGEHVEMHMLVGSIERRKSLTGFVRNRLVDTGKIKRRHDDLAHEMLRRGMRHSSPLLYIDRLHLTSVDPEANLIELRTRCQACAARQTKEVTT